VHSKDSWNPLRVEEIARFRLVLSSALLLLLNAYICRELFITEYTRHLGSIEAAYMGISRWLVLHPTDLNWFPLWYGGEPFQNSYPPLMHLLVGGLAWISDSSPALAHHRVSAALYCLGPVTLFLSVYVLSRQWSSSFGAALLYSLVSPAGLLLPDLHPSLASFVRALRLNILVEFGEGPHVSSLALLPLGLLALHQAIEKGGVVRTYLAASVLATIALTNWLGTFSFALLVFSYLLARWGEPRWSKNVLIVAGICGIAYALAATWLPPSTVRDISRNAQQVGGRFPLGSVQLVGAALLLVATVGLRWAVHRIGAPLMTRCFAVFALLTGALVCSNAWLNVQIVPQPHRYQLEMEMAICVVAALCAAPLLTSRSKALKLVFGIAALVLAVVLVKHHRREARQLIQPIDMTRTLEYRAATWLDRQLPGQRAFVDGSTSPWLNVFGDTPELGGGFGQGIVNPLIPMVNFGIPFTKGNGPETAMWLRVLGAQAVFVSGPGEREDTKIWQDPGKFEGVLPELWREGDDVIYAVPQRATSLAHLIRTEQRVRRTPMYFEDYAPILPLSAALEDASLPVVNLEWVTPGTVRITIPQPTPGETSRGQLLFLQITYHPGWHASVGAEQRRVEADALGFMVLDPACNGPCEVILRFDGGIEMLLARALTLTSVLGGLAWALLYGRRLRR